MNWPSFADFVAMGGYGTYVWGSYAATVACIVLELLAIKARRKAALRALPGAVPQPR